MTVVNADPAVTTAVAATPSAVAPATANPAAATTATSPSTAGEATSSDSFDAASIEEAFGLPAGALKDVKDTDSALSAVREYTDKVTAAGLGLESPFAAPAAPAVVTAPAKQPGQPAVAPAEGEKPTFLTKADIDKMFADRDHEQQTKQSNAMLAELQRRLDAEVDIWASPKYGVGKQRTVKQIRAKKDLDDLILTHIAGASAMGDSLPVAEVLARRVRLLDDETYKPGVAGAAAVPLGTPGASKVAASEAKEGPRNIHEAVLGRRIS